MSEPRILLFDRASASTDRLLATLRAAGLDVRHTPDPEGAAAALRDDEVEVLLGELDASKNLLRSALELPDAPELVLFEDFSGLQDAFVELRELAFDTLERPVPDEEVLRVVRRALRHRDLVAENRRLRSEVGERFELGSLVSRDPRMGSIFETLSAVAESSASILLTGESGTGKTVLARAIHEGSARSGTAFVAVNCGAIPASLLESELFGHAKGAFTGAIKDRAGKFEAADGGTIFLDEIATASPELQVKLLRVIEEGRFERVGETETRSVDARLISATNADLEAEVEAGRFRADLFYRVHVVGIEVPPLRDRAGDIPLLADRFLVRFAQRHGRDVRAIDPGAEARLVAHGWPGNVRELENTIERAVLLSHDSVLGVDDLWPDGSTGTGGSPGDGEPERPASTSDAPRLEELPLGPLKESLGPPERWLILRALRFHAGNRQATARALGINRTTLFNKMRKYDLLSLPHGSTAGPAETGGDSGAGDSAGSNGREAAGGHAG